MSAQEERNALTPPTGLYDHALRLLREATDGVPPRRGYSLPRKTATGEEPLSRQEAKSGVLEALSPLPDNPATLRRRFERLRIQDRHRHLITSAVTGLPLPAEEVDAALALGRQLIRTGTTAPTVIAGIALLGRLGGPEDVPYLRVLGLFRDLTGPAVNVIPDDGTPPEAQAAAALRRLAEEDPKSYARVCGGSRERAEELGFPWPGSA